MISARHRRFLAHHLPALVWAGLVAAALAGAGVAPAVRGGGPG